MNIHSRDDMADLMRERGVSFVFTPVVAEQPDGTWVAHYPGAEWEVTADDAETARLRLRAAEQDRMRDPAGSDWQVAAVRKYLTEGPDFRKAVRCQCIEPPPGVPAGTAGAAFDYLLRYTLGTDDPADLAVGGAVFAPQTRRWAPVVVDLAADLLNTADRWKSSSVGLSLRLTWGPHGRALP